MFVARKRYLKTRARRTPPSRINFGKVKNPRVVNARPRGVTVSTLDSESSDRGSNPREALCRQPGPSSEQLRCENQKHRAQKQTLQTEENIFANSHAQFPHAESKPTSRAPRCHNQVFNRRDKGGCKRGIVPPAYSIFSKSLALRTKGAFFQRHSCKGRLRPYEQRRELWAPNRRHRMRRSNVINEGRSVSPLWGLKRQLWHFAKRLQGPLRISPSHPGRAGRAA